MRFRFHTLFSGAMMQTGAIPTFVPHTVSSHTEPGDSVTNTVPSQTAVNSGVSNTKDAVVMREQNKQIAKLLAELDAANELIKKVI